MIHFQEVADERAQSYFFADPGNSSVKMIKMQGGVFGTVSNSDTLIRSLP